MLKTLFMTTVVAGLTAFSSIGKLEVTSTAFSDNGLIPAKYSCEGEEVSPPLSIKGIPAGAKSLAIILHDPDAQGAGGFTHWVVWNIDVANNALPENFKGADQGLNGTGQPGYKGMCPPTGTHHYHFMVYALDTKLSIDSRTDKAALEKSMEGHILAQGEIIGLYKKTRQ